MHAYMRLIFVWVIICQMAFALPAPEPLDASATDGDSSSVVAAVAGDVAAPKDLDTANTFGLYGLGYGGLYGGFGFGGYGYGYPYGRYYGYGYPYGGYLYG